MAFYEKGLVSVVMPTYKRSEKLLRAVDSVLSQTYTHVELLLVNDNEPDDEFSLELKKKVEKYFEDERFKLILQEKHINGAVARNVGIREAKGEYIAFLDDDDWWEKEKIEHQIKELENLSEEWGGVSCKFRLFDKNQNLIGKSIKYPDGNIYKDILSLTSDVATGTLLLRREAFDKTRYFDENLLRHQDLQLLVDFTYLFKLKEVDEYLHCVDVSDTQNRPDGEKLIQHKKKFFESIKHVMDTLPSKEQKCIYCLHKYELAYVFMKNRQYKRAFRYFSELLLSPKAIGIATKKTFFKVISILSK